MNVPDLAMCLDDDCPRAKECYRHEAVPSGLRQAFANFNYDPPDYGCRYFAPIYDKPAQDPTP